MAGQLTRESAEFLGLTGLEDAKPAEIADLIEKREAALAQGLEAGEAELMANVEVFAGLLRLSSAEKDLLALFAAISTHPTLQALLERVDARSRHQAIRALAVVLGHEVEAIREALRPEAPLGRFGVLNVAGGTYDFCQFALLNEELDRALSSGQPAEAELLSSFFNIAPRSRLHYNDYAHLEPRLGTVVELLRGAGAVRAQGVNVLLYGVVGTGKTELARAIAERLRWQAYEVKTTNRDGSGSTSDERMSSYTLAQRFLERMTNRLVVFDELEDLLGEGGALSRRYGKLYFNRLLETNTVPTIWIANDIEALGAAARRRFDFSIAFGALPGIARRRVLERHLAGFDAELKADLAQRETLLPAQVATGRKVAKLTSSRKGAVVEAVNASMKLLGQPTTKASTTLDFDVGLCNADVDLVRAAAAFKSDAAHGLICLYGPPGVGKSALAGHLAETVGRTAVRFAASDLLSAFVGESEQRVARAFDGIDVASEVLVIEEADELLAVRTASRQSWEIRLLNEMLARIDAYVGIGILTTNALDRIDGAVLRRCELKVRLDYLRADQRERMWRRVTGTEVAAATASRLAELDQLTAGDFVAVLGQAKLVGKDWAAADWIAALEKEQSLKPTVRPIGFV